MPMSKRTCFIFLPILVLLLLCGAKAHALFNIFKAGGTIPVVGAVEIPTETIRLVQGYLSEATALKNQITDNAVNMMKSAKSIYSGAPTASVAKIAIKGTKTIAESKIANIKEPTSVEQALDILFFKYPTDDNNARNAYRKKAVAFYDDTVLEAYTTARQLDKRLEEEIRPLVEKLPENLVASGEGGGETPDSLNATYVNYYKAYQALDSIMAVVNEINAIKAQMRAALAIRNEITPLSCAQQAKLKADNAKSGKGMGLLAAAKNTVNKVKDKVDKAKDKIDEAKEKVDEAKAKVDEAKDKVESYKDQYESYKNTVNNTVNTVKSAGDVIDAVKSGDWEQAASLAEQTYDSAKTSAQDIKTQAGTLGDTARSLQSDIKSTTQDIKSTTQDVKQEIKSFRKRPNVSLAPLSGPIYASATFSATAQMAFAQQSSISFAVQPEPDLTPDENTLKLQELEKIQPIYKDMRKAMEAHNTILKLPQYRNIQKQYNNTVKLHEKAIENLRQSEEAALEYMESHFNDAVKVWSGVPMSADPSAHELRKGLSGWAIEAFEVAKAGSAAPTDAEDFVEIEVDTNLDSGNLQTTETVKGQLEEIDTFFAEPSKEEEYEEQSRAADMISWQIGAQAAKSLEAGTWGSLKEPFPIWNDQKSFYDQYLKGKYQNIIDYLNALSVADINAKITKALNDELAALRAEEERKINEAALEQINKLQTARETQITEIDELQTSARQQVEEARDKELSEVREEKEQSIRELESRQSSLRADMDKQAAEIAATKTEIKQAEAELSLKQEAVEITLEELQISRAEADGREAELLDRQQKEQAEVKAQSEQIVSLQNRQKELEESLRQSTQELEKLTAKIAEIESAYQDAAAEINSTAADKLAEIKSKRDDAAQVIEDEFDSKKAAIEEASDKQKAAIEVENTLKVSTITTKAAEFIDVARGKAEAEVRAAEAELKAMGDDLYRPENYARIQTIHNNLITRLQTIKLEITGVQGALLTTIEIYKDFLSLMDISPDTEYFVAANATNPRVFKAPKAPLSLSSAPVREIVHMDDTDWSNIPRGKDGVVTKEGFLAYGGEIPEIWKLLLKDKAFVETDINLKEVLSKGGEKVFLLRGGVYPCRLNGKIIDVRDPLKTPLLGLKVGLMTTSEEGDLPTCRGLSLSGNKLSNPRAEADVTVSDGDNGEVEYSELGVFLSADDKNNLYLKDDTAEIFEKVIKIDTEYKDGTRTDETVAKMSDAEKMEEDIYMQSVFSRNLVGEFLRSAEREQIYREAEEELRQSNEDARNSLIEILSGLGLEVSPNFDLSKEADMKQIQSQLDSVKNKYLSAAQSGAAGVNTSSELAKEQLNGINNTLRALAKDSEELVTISESTDSGASLDEAIISAKTNNEVKNTYEKEADTQMEKLGKLALPYAPSY